jgi:hypothetical protein
VSARPQVTAHEGAAQHSTPELAAR